MTENELLNRFKENNFEELEFTVGGLYTRIIPCAKSPLVDAFGNSIVVKPKDIDSIDYFLVQGKEEAYKYGTIGVKINDVSSLIKYLDGLRDMLNKRNSLIESFAEQINFPVEEDIEEIEM